MDIRGTRVLLTGASGGLGEAIAQELHARGAAVVLSGRRQDVLEPLSDRLRASTLLADLTLEEGLDRIVECARRVDVLVANAGVSGESDLMRTGSDDIDRMIDVNLRGPIITAVEFAKERVRLGSPGHVVLVGSLAGMIASPNARLYDATKFGLRGFALALRLDLAGTGVGVSLVAPSFIRDSGMFADSAEVLPRGVRLKSPQDVARGVASAIERNRAEVFVAPMELRVAATLGGAFPRLVETAQRLRRGRPR